MIEEITKNVSRIYIKGIHSCNSYFIKDRRILIDCCSKDAEEAFKKSLPVAPEDVSMVFLTHLHHDHIGGFNIFKDTPLFASKRSLELLHDDPNSSILNLETVQDFYASEKEIKEFPLERMKDIGFTVLDTPGHADGSVSLLFQDKDGTKILFPGDLFFDPEMKVLGRTDLPTSDEKQMTVSLRKMSTVRYDILCPGHGRPEKKN